MGRQTLLLATVVAMAACASSSQRSAADAAAGIDAGSGGVKGTTTPPSLDPRAIGAFDLSKVTVAAFSQTSPAGQDAQVLALAPDVVPRAWGQWNRSGLQASDYTAAYPTACRANGTLFVGGLTASVIFPGEMDDAAFADEVGRDAAGQPVVHAEIAATASRGSLASPAFRKLLVDIAKLQIDAGADGVFFDEANAGYGGARYDGNEGFDDHHVADFGRFLCAGHGDAATLAGFDLVAADGLDCAAVDPGAGFNYRGYLARHGWQTSPLSASNPLASLWGTTIQNRPDPTKPTFVETYPMLVYWQEIVVAVRTYARQQYNKEVVITSNGIFPFVDFQSVGLYDWNKDSSGAKGFDYVPTVTTGSTTHLDGTISFLPVLQSLKARSKRIVEATGGHEVPLLLFIDWPTDTINRYYALSPDERKDYVRLRLAEAYAFGMWFALPLSTTTDSHTATALGMMEFFQSMRDFYRAHAPLVRVGADLPVVPTLSATGVDAHVVGLGNITVVHLINHSYNAGFVPVTALTVTLPLAQAPVKVTIASPDQAADQVAAFTYADGTLTVTVPALVSSAMLVIE